MGITLKPGDVTFSFGPSAVGLSETTIQLLVGMERSSSSSGSGQCGEHLRRWGQLFSLEGRSRLRKPHQSCLKPETQRCTDRHMLTARFRSIKHPLQQGRMGSAQDAEPPDHRWTWQSRASKRISLWPVQPESKETVWQAGWRSQQRGETEKQIKWSSLPCCTTNSYTTAEDFSQDIRTWPQKWSQKTTKGLLPHPCQVGSAQTSALLTLLQLGTPPVPPSPADPLSSHAAHLLRGHHGERSALRAVPRKRARSLHVRGR